MQFDQKVVWITGASSGIGEALAHEFAKQGAQLVLSGRNKSALEQVKAQLPETKSTVIPLDLTAPNQIAEAVHLVLSTLGRVDILINNAGISQRSLLMDTDESVERKIMEVNFFGSVALTKKILPTMISQKSGHLVVISSVVGKAGVPGRSAYGASKHALHGYFDALRAEMHQNNIAVTLICPGYVQTQISMNALTGDGTSHQKMDGTTANGLTAPTFARRAVKAIAQKRNEVYLGKWELMAIYLNRLSPALYAKVLRRFKVKNL